MGLRPMAPRFFEADENRKADFASASQPRSEKGGLSRLFSFVRSPMQTGHDRRDHRDDNADLGVVTPSKAGSAADLCTKHQT